VSQTGDLETGVFRVVADGEAQGDRLVRDGIIVKRVSICHLHWNVKRQGRCRNLVLLDEILTDEKIEGPRIEKRF
jgi:hypothetical protein